MDWEVYTTPTGYRAELFRGPDPTLLTVIRSRWRPVLYARMLVAQWMRR